MEWQGLAQRRTREDPLRSQIGRLIEVVGTPKFETEMFKIARTATNCEHLTAFAVGSSGAPRMLLAANTGALPIARSLAQRYVAKYWNLDPASRFEGSDSAIGGDMMLRIFPDDIDDSSYRYECYTAVKLRDRFTVMQRRGDEVYRINFYRASSNGCFVSSDVEHMVNSADLLIALLVKHVASGAADGTSTHRLFQDRLRLIEPTMPAREVEVCAGIGYGMTSEAISLTLGISVNTVLTYRKRAYGRLGISCQNELMRLVLS